ncbi:Uncharacterized protein HZ326_20922, partial [Fusarium oxysporum f. sp. albedinis]
QEGRKKWVCPHPRPPWYLPKVTGATLGGGGEEVGLILVEASHLIITEPFWAPGREEQVIERAHRLPQKREVHVCRAVSHPSMVDELVNDSRSSQLGQIHKDLHGVLIGKDDETFHRELLSTRAAPEQEEEEEEEVEVRVELLDLEDANDRIMKRINAN